MAMPALASDCAITIASDDKMQFDIKNVVVPKTCRQYTMTLTHVGKMSKATMGHNLVLSTTADANAVAADARRLQLQAWCMPRLHQAFCRSGTWVTMSA
ncbi:plastocyanin/azurin family copper-binding protein [Comamonas kerstersii]|nr:plastocyanin/azurin family copper-binding protein [Comamonas kerstersii]KAB0586665.1 hypothetical protein F7P80_09890 [Comamonas kerstersii]